MLRRFKTTSRWIWRYVHWGVVQAKLSWLALGSIVLACVVMFFLGPSEPVIRLTGLGFQLCGIATVIWGIELTRRLFDHPTLLAVIAKWWAQRPQNRRGAIIEVSEPLDTMTALGRVSITTGPPVDATLEQRIASLETNVGYLNKRIDDSLQELDKLDRAQKAALSQERQERITGTGAIAEKLETSSTGGLHISAVGALWLVIGVSLSSAAQEIAQLFE